MNVGWEAEWRVALRRRRLLALDFAVPFLLVAALVAGRAPAWHAAAVVAVLFVVFGVFGSAVPLVRDGDRGLITRWILAGVRPRAYLGGRLAAQSLLDLLQLLPAALLAVWRPGVAPGAVAAVVGALLVALLVANALGAWVAAAARSHAEAALFGAVSGLLLLHFGGVFRTPAAGSWQASVETFVPFRLLHEAVLAAHGYGEPVAEPVPPLAASLAFLALTWGAAPTLLRRLTGDAEEPV